MSRCRPQNKNPRVYPALLEALETRVLLSGAGFLVQNLAEHAPLLVPQTSTAPKTQGPRVTAGFSYPIAVQKAVTAAYSSPPAGYFTPQQLQHAYGVDQVSFGSVPGDGRGITIAIVDAYDFPSAATDVNTFSTAYGLPLFNQGGSSPTFTKVSQSGGSTSGVSYNAGWSLEEAIDIEWAHAIAPMANIMLVEAASSSDANLYAAVNWAKTSAASVISMSWGGDESSGDPSNNSTFTTPAGHGGVTFLAATGDNGAYSDQTGSAYTGVITPGYPADSPNVVAVGGTSLYLSGGNYSSENGWGNGTASQTSNGSGGGISLYETKPSYQSGVTYSATNRTIPDVSMLADPNTGVFICNSTYYGASTPWNGLWGGTSLACPMFAAVVAIADQGRVAAGLSTLDGPTQTLPALYQLSTASFHDITSGSNGPSPTYAAGTGYDLVTGRGTPVANVLIPNLIGAGSISGTVFQDNNSNGAQNPGEPGLAGVTVYLDSNNNGVLDASGSGSASASNLPLNIGQGASGSATASVSGVSGLISHVTVSFSITIAKDSVMSAVLIGPDSTQITLFSGVGGSAANFTSTTLDDSAATSITSGSAPFTGTYSPSPGALGTFNGKTANGTWSFKVTNSSGRARTATITAFSINITTTGETSTVTDANGNYSFQVAYGTYTVREVTPATYFQTTPTSGSAITASVSGALTGQNFSNFPTIFTSTNPGDAFYLRQDTQSNLQIFNAAAPAGTPAYQVPMANLPALTFNLLGAADSFGVDFTNGPLTANGITVAGGAGAGDLLQVVGSPTVPSATISDALLTPASGGTLNLSGFNSLSVSSATVGYAAAGFKNISVDSTSVLNVLNGGSPRVLTLSSLTIAVGGKMDMGANDLILDYTGGSSPLAAITAMLQAGNNGGNWQGAGLMSSAAAANANHYTLGVVDNATNSSHYDVYDGVNTASHQQVLVKFTYVDDLDLDGSVTLNDAVVFGGRFSLGATASYQFGDLNYNGVYDLNDATTFGGAYNTALPPMPVI